MWSERRDRLAASESVSQKRKQQLQAEEEMEWQVLRVFTSIYREMLCPLGPSVVVVYTLRGEERRGEVRGAGYKIQSSRSLAWPVSFSLLLLPEATVCTLPVGSGTRTCLA